MEDGKITFTELEQGLEIFKDYTNERNKVLDIESFSKDEIKELTSNYRICNPSSSRVDLISETENKV